MVKRKGKNTFTMYYKPVPNSADRERWVVEIKSSDPRIPIIHASFLKLKHLLEDCEE